MSTDDVQRVCDSLLAHDFSAISAARSEVKRLTTWPTICGRPALRQVPTMSTA